MLKFLLNDKEIPVTGVHLIQDISYYYSITRFTTMAVIAPGTIVIMRDKTDTKLYILNSYYTGNAYEYIAVTEKQIKVLKSVTSPVSGEFTLKQLFNHLSLTAEFQEDSAKTYWCLGSNSVLSLLSTINSYVTPARGSAPRVYMDTDGILRYLVISNAYESKVSTLKGKVEDDSIDTEWFITTPSRLNVISSDTKDDKVQELLLGEGLQTKSLNATEFMTGASQLEIQRIKNEYYSRYYQARKLHVIDVRTLPLRLGMCVMVNDVVKGIISSIDIPIMVNNEVVSFSVNVVCPK